MVVSRKEKESFLGRNLFYLRKQKGQTLEEMADLLELNSKSSYKAYEEERALPDIHKVMRLASYFDIAVADLMYQDLARTKNDAVQQERRMYEIPKIPIAAAAGYARSFGEHDFVMSLDTIKIPFEPYGVARAFEIEGDSMEPEIEDGSMVIGIRVSNSTMRDNKSYVVVTTDGVQCKRIRVEERDDVIYLLSANTKYPPKHIDKEKVIEVWEVWKIM